MRPRRRTLLLAGALALALAPAASAPAPAPADTRSFDDVPAGTPADDAYPDLTVFTSECAATVQPDPTPAVPGDQALYSACGDVVEIGFAGPQAQVSMNLWTQTTSFAAAQLQGSLTITAWQDSSEVPVASAGTAVEDATWAPLTVTAPGGAAIIDSVTVASDQVELRIDDLTFAPAAQPDTGITGGPPGVSASSSATFQLAASVAGSTFECSLDGALPAPCSASPGYSGLGDGPHSFEAAAIDPYGNRDATPARRTWTVDTRPPAAGGPVDGDGDGTPDDRDNCPADANPDQADQDADAIGNACETLPSGTLEPIAGVRSTVRLVAGEVLVKLPTRTVVGAARSAQLRPGFVPIKGLPPGGRPASRFVPLEGVASLPIGSTIDARKGQVSMTSAATFRRPRGSRDVVTQSGRFSAAIFTIKQRRRARSAPRGRATTDLVLRTPAGAARACAAGAPPPPKGIVRSLSGTVTSGSGPAKGVFRSVGAASVATVKRGIWITQDRCNGTLTEVGTGRATVYDRARDRTVTVGPGRGYLARARLFAAKRRRAQG